MEMEQLDLYLKYEWGYMHLLWSDNPPADPETATAVISINLYDTEGGEIDGGEMDIQNENDVFDLKLYVKESMKFMEVMGEYEEISEDDFYEAVKDSYEAYKQF